MPTRKTPRKRTAASARTTKRVVKKKPAAAKTKAVKQGAPRGAKAVTRRPLARAVARAAAGWERLVPPVRAALGHKHVPDPGREVVETLAAVAAGYRKGPGADPPFRVAFDADRAVANAVVDVWVDGTRGNDRTVHRPTVRAGVDQNLALLGVRDTGELARDTLTWLSLGAWDPQRDEVARRNRMPGVFVGLYAAGRRQPG